MDDRTRLALRRLDDVQAPFSTWNRVAEEMDAIVAHMLREVRASDEAVRENHLLMVRYRTAINNALQVKGIGTDNLQASSTMASILRAALRDD